MKKTYGVICGAIGAVSLMATNALAVLPADQLAVTAAIDTNITDLTTWAWTAILAIVTFTVGAKLLKRFLGRI